MQNLNTGEQGVSETPTSEEILDFFSGSQPKSATTMRHLYQRVEDTARGMHILNAESYIDPPTIAAAQHLASLAQTGTDSTDVSSQSGARGDQLLTFGFSGGFEVARTKVAEENEGSSSYSETSSRASAPNMQPKQLYGGIVMTPTLTRKYSGDKSKREKKNNNVEMSEADEDAAKRRGRRRLNTQDETPAERRRTQIRMAQRAYRHRKETTISSLEQQVEELTKQNKEMRTALLELETIAAQDGLLAREPRFGRRLRSTVQQTVGYSNLPPDSEIVPRTDYNQQQALGTFDYHSAAIASLPQQANAQGNQSSNDMERVDCAYGVKVTFEEDDIQDDFQDDFNYDWVLR